jgi:hypothetical protein
MQADGVYRINTLELFWPRNQSNHLLSNRDRADPPRIWDMFRNGQGIAWEKTIFRHLQGHQSYGIWLMRRHFKTAVDHRASIIVKAFENQVVFSSQNQATWFEESSRVSRRSDECFTDGRNGLGPEVS